MSIFLFAYFGLPEYQQEQRSVFPAAYAKISYIKETLKHLNHEVIAVSASRTEGRQTVKGHTIKIDDLETNVFFPSFGLRGKLSRVLRSAQFHIELQRFIKKNITMNDVVFVYHSMGYMQDFVKLKKEIGFRLVLEVEEIYSDVLEEKQLRIKEIASMSNADAYIFPTQLLNTAVNLAGKPSVIIHGTYRVEPQRKNCSFESDPLHEKKHLLYAGTFDPRKGGAQAAVAAAQYLSSDYHIHILGFGSEGDVKALQDEVERVTKNGGAKVTMDGLLSGEEYIRFVQSCDVGLSTQIPNAAFNDTSFPSKVLSYLANGLRVVTVRIPVLEDSAVNNLLTYYDGNDPKSIAEAVLHIDWQTKFESRKEIEHLNAMCCEAVQKLLQIRS